MFFIAVAASGSGRAAAPGDPTNVSSSSPPRWLSWVDLCFVFAISEMEKETVWENAFGLLTLSRKFSRKETLYLFDFYKRASYPRFRAHARSVLIETGRASVVFFWSVYRGTRNGCSKRLRDILWVLCCAKCGISGDIVRRKDNALRRLARHNVADS